MFHADFFWLGIESTSLAAKLVLCVGKGRAADLSRDVSRGEMPAHESLVGDRKTSIF